MEIKDEFEVKGLGEWLKAVNRGKYGMRVLVGRDYILVVEIVPFPPYLFVDGVFPRAWMDSPWWGVEWTYLQLDIAMKRKERKRAELEARAAHDEEFRASYPNLFDHLTSTSFDGEAAGSRVVSTLLVFCADGVFKACLRERNDGICLWTAGASFGDVLTVLERELENDTGVWRADRVMGAPVASRKPKPKSP